MNPESHLSGLILACYRGGIYLPNQVDPEEKPLASLTFKP